MKMRFEFPGGAPSAPPQRGAAPVGFLHELPPVELAAIIYLRAWCEGGSSRQIIDKDFCLVMGKEAGAKADRSFDALMAMFLNNARRPVMRHGLGCKCFGGDESAFANMIAAAAGQDREDAQLFACTLMTGHAIWSAVQLALGLGQAFLRLATMPDRTLVPTHGSDPNFTKH
jgi:hypothetical protein